MTPYVRVAVGIGCVAINLALAAAPRPPSTAWIHPVAPPLTHIPELGEPMLGTVEAVPAVPPAIAHAPAPRAPGAPPLRGLAGAVERVVRATGSAEQRAAIVALRARDRATLPLAERATALRRAVQAHAVAIASALGDARVGRILARKDALSTELGEGRAWEAARARVSR